MINDPLFILAAIACLVVVAILALGIGSFGRGGEYNRRNANRLMRYRLAAQAVAVALIVGFAWLRARG
ncbi:MAG: twin transmembrane helix small protein [Paracoccaceae bacterium]